jgi:V/A-type H+/Na+-transporting ATPase subunit D
VDAPSATRSELLARRRRANLAVQGRDLLQDKRTALVRAFQARSTSLLQRLEELARDAAQAHRRLDRARAELGTGAVESASFAAAGRIGVRLTDSAVAGVVVVDAEHAEVRRAPGARGSETTLVDPHVDAAADAFEEEVDALLDLAALELTVRRLAGEIARTTRQVNGLEHVVIPRLRGEARRIALALDEREREEIARLKRARTQARRRGQARSRSSR